MAPTTSGHLVYPKMSRRGKDRETFKSYINIGEKSEHLLISFDEEPEDPKTDLLGSPDLSSKSNQNDSLLDRPEKDDSSEKLCGYLNKYKIGARGIGKLFKKRWFVYGDKTCTLLYFRTPQDIVPLGEIELANASLYYDPADDHPNVFEIRSV